MSYHPAIGNIRAQLPRIAFIAALLAAAGTLIALHQERASMPSERWYRLSRQRVMEADLLWRMGEAVDTVGARTGLATRETAGRMREQAIATWEKSVLRDKPSHAAAYRLGAIYGHRDYPEQAADMLTLAAGLDEEHSDFYHAVSEVYSNEELGEEELREKIRVISEREGWLVDLVLSDCYDRLGDEDMLRRVMDRQHARSMRFAAGLSGITGIVGLLMGLGVVTIGILIARHGFHVSERAARLPFMVPWTLIDVAEAVAVLLFAMVVGGLVTSVTVGPLLPSEAPLGRPLTMAIQYILVAAVTIGVIAYRTRNRSSHPLRTLGMRFRRSAGLVGTGLAGYSIFLTGLVIVASIIGSLIGDAVPLGQTTEEIIGSAQTPGEIAIYFALVCIIAPIVEELVFRGYVYGGLRRLMSARQAIVLGAAIFAAVHLNVEALLIIGLIGAMLCYLYERSRSLLPGMVAHGVHNGLVFAVMLLQSA